MAQFVFTSNTYAGEALAGFMASTLLEADSVKRGLLTVIPDVKARKLILDVDDDVIFQDRNAKFQDQATTAKQNETYLDPVIYEFMKEQDWSALVQSWESEQLKPGGMQDYDGVVELSDFLVSRYIEKMAIANDRLYWLGKGSTREAKFTDPFLGMLPTIAANGSTYKVNLSDYAITGATIAATGIVTIASTAALRTGDTVTITAVTGAITETTNSPAIAISGNSYRIQVLSPTTFKLNINYNEVNTRKAATFSGTATAATISFINQSNVIAVLASVYSQLDYADRSQPDFNLQIPLHVGFAYAQAQAAATTNVNETFTLPKEMAYLGIKLQLMNHWQANTILGARSSNLFLGVDLLGDGSSLATVNMSQYTLDGVVRMKASMKAAVNAKFFNELFYLSA